MMNHLHKFVFESYLDKKRNNIQSVLIPSLERRAFWRTAPTLVPSQIGRAEGLTSLTPGVRVCFLTRAACAIQLNNCNTRTVNISKRNFHLGCHNQNAKLQQNLFYSNWYALTDSVDMHEELKKKTQSGRSGAINVFFKTVVLQLLN